MTSAEQQLKDVRKTIDAIDNQMLALIDQRLELAKSLRAYKPANRAAWAPAREHALLQRLLNQKSDPFAAKTMITMWSALITCSVMSQGPFVILSPESQISALAQTAFPGAPVEKLDINNWRTQTQQTPGAVAVLGFPGHAQNWWHQLTRPGPQLYVQSILPKWPPNAPSACCLSVDKPTFRDGQVCWTLLQATDAAAVQGTTIAQHKNWKLIETPQPLELGSDLPHNTNSAIFIGSFFPSLNAKSP